MIDIKELRDTFDYHPDGYLIRRSTGRPCGQRANNGNGYVRVWVGGRTLHAHRVIYAIVYGEMPDGDIDHISRNRMDNRIENLRDVSRSENMHNSKKSKDNSSGFPGVGWHTQAQKWVAYIYIDYRKIHLGYFEDLEDAVHARKIAKIKYHPTSPEAAKYTSKRSLEKSFIYYL